MNAAKPADFGWQYNSAGLYYSFLDDTHFFMTYKRGLRSYRDTSGFYGELIQTDTGTEIRGEFRYEMANTILVVIFLFIIIIMVSLANSFSAEVFLIAAIGVSGIYLFMHWLVLQIAAMRNAEVTDFINSQLLK